MSTTTMQETLSGGEVKRLSRLASKLEQDAKDARLAGLDERAEGLEAETRTVRGKVEADKEAKAEQRERARQAEERRREELRQREQEEREAIGRAVAFLETALSAAPQGRIPKAPLLADAEAEGIALHRLAEAARRLELKELAHPVPGRATIPSAERYWGRPSFSGIPMNLGPAKT